jgi:FtsP/CotA-like multicopper oxidase with cupredoxin domain
MRSAAKLLALALVLVGCRDATPSGAGDTGGGSSDGSGPMSSGSSESSESGNVVEPLPDPLAPPELADLDPDPGVVEVSLVAEAAQTTYLDDKVADVLAYRDGSVAGAVGTVPGPLLRARRGDHVIVHFENRLDAATTIHWHGLRPPNTSDGTVLTVEPGDTFDYEFDALDAGTFWYHPHVDAEVQIEAGLYAPLVVEEGDAPQVEIDRILFLDDIKLESDGKLSTQTDSLDLMMGRQGNVLLVDGRREATVPTRTGGLERWRVLNAANGRYFNLRLPGHELLVFAWDGGRLPEPYVTDRLLVSPGERYEVLVSIQGEVGDVLELQTVHYDRGHNLPDPGPRTILSLEIEAVVDAPQPIPDDLAGPFEPIPTDATTPVRSFVLTEQEEGLPEPIFMINGEVFGEHTVLDGMPGDVEIWEIENDSEMDHPFHTHGMFFQVLNGQGAAAEHQGWKDTVNIPRDTTLSFAIRLGEPGMWMYHCHILEHAERGMMGEIMIMPR